MFEVNKDSRMTNEEKILFNIQEILKEMNSKLDTVHLRISNSVNTKLTEQFPYANINVNTNTNKLGDMKIKKKE